MPPKFKFKKEEIVHAALEITRERGLTATTARAVGDKLNSSSKVIFGIFENMEELHKNVFEAAKAEFREYMKQTPYDERGVGYIQFAMQEPKLFQLLFMSDLRQGNNIAELLPLVDDNYQENTAELQEAYGISREIAEKLNLNTWIYCHGIAALCASDMYQFSREEIKGMIKDVFSSLMEKYKAEKTNK